VPFAPGGAEGHSRVAAGDVELRHHQARRDVQGLRGRRRLADRQPASGRRRQRVGLDGPGADLQAELDDVLRQEAVWADNAQSSPFFGNVYVCWRVSAARRRERPSGPLIVARSADGGSTWTQKQVGPATSNGVNSQPDGCTVRTDSHGNLYVFGVGSRGGTSFEMMYKSTDGGAHFTGPGAAVGRRQPPGSSTRSSAAR